MADPESDDRMTELLDHFDRVSRLGTADRAHEERLRAVLLSFIDVMDSFDRLVGPDQNANVDVSWSGLSSVRLIAKQMERALQAAGVVAVSSLGSEPDPLLHEIVGVKQVSGGAENAIVEEIQRAYVWDGALIRKGRVIVATAAREPQEG